MKDEINNENQSEYRFFIAALQFLLVSIMLSCFASIIGKMLQTIYPDWVLTGFPFLAFIFTFSSLILRHYQRNQSRLSKNSFLLISSELVFIIVIIKIYSLILNGISDNLGEISLWENDFLNSFFDLGTLLRTIGILLVWFLSWLFSFPLSKLEDDPFSTNLENLGRTFNEIQRARKDFFSLIFPLGLTMIGLMSIIQFFPSRTQYELGSLRNPLIPLLIYFCAAFLLLAIYHYLVMKAYWKINKIPIKQDLSIKWIVYTLLFIISIVVTINFLPTNFTIGVESLFQIITNIFMLVLAIFYYIFYITFALFASLVSLLFPDQPINEQMQQQFEEFTPPAVTESTAIPWLDFVKSILFFVTFLSIIIFSLYYFFKNREGFEFFFKKIKFFKRVKGFLEWLKRQLSTVHGFISESVQKGSESILSFFKNRKINLPSLTSVIKKLPPRQIVILAYIDWIFWNVKYGINRKKSQTPFEYAKSCSQYNPQATYLIKDLTHRFIIARYTRAQITKVQAQEAQHLLELLKESFRQMQENQEVQ